MFAGEKKQALTYTKCLISASYITVCPDINHNRQGLRWECKWMLYFLCHVNILFHTKHYQRLQWNMQLELKKEQISQTATLNLGDTRLSWTAQGQQQTTIKLTTLLIFNQAWNSLQNNRGWSIHTWFYTVLTESLRYWVCVQEACADLWYWCTPSTVILRLYT